MRLGAGEGIDAFVFRVAGVAFDPNPLDLVAAEQAVQRLPEVDVFDFRFLIAGAPVVLFPVGQPFGDAVHNITAVGVQRDVAFLFEGFQRLNHRRQFHAVVGGFPFAAAQLLFRVLMAENGAPAAGAGIARAGAVCENFNPVHLKTRS